MSPDLEPVAETLDEVFARLGLANPEVIADLSSNWDEVAGHPWAGRSRPLVVKGKTLIVEASQPSVVAFLRYGSAALLATLEERLGQGVVTTIEVVSPGLR